MLKRIVLAFVIFFAFASYAFAASVTVNSVVIPAWARSGNDVELRIFVDTTFIASDNTIVIAGAPGGFQNYRTFTCTVDSNAKTLTINPGALFSTTDGKNIQTSRYTAYLVQSTTGVIIQPYLVQFTLPPTPNPATWRDIIEFNSLGAPIPIDRDTYSKTQVNDLIQQFKDALMVSGIVTPVAGGTGLSVTNQSGFLVALTGTYSLRTITDADVPDTITASNYILTTARGGVNGVAPLDAGSLVPTTNIPNLQDQPGVLDGPSGGTGFSSYTKGDTLVADAGGNLAKLAGDNSGTKKFYTQTSLVSSYNTIAGADLPLGLSATPTLNAVPNGDGANYSITTTPTIAGLTTTAVAAITVGATGGNAGEVRLKDADGTVEYIGLKGSSGRSANLIIIMPSGNPTNGDMLVFGTPSGGTVTTSFAAPTVPGSGINTAKIEGTSVSALNSIIDFVGATSTGTVGGAGPFVGLDSGGADKIALRTSPDNSAILVGTARTITTSTGLTGGGTLAADRTLSVVADSTVQKVAVGVNGVFADVGTRRRIDYKSANSNMTIAAVDDAGNNEVGVTFTVSATTAAHNFLDSTIHNSTTTHALIAGDKGGLIRVNSSDNAYEFFKPSASNQAVFFNGTNTVFGALDLSTAIVTGVLPSTSGSLGLDASGVTNGQIPIGNDSLNRFVLGSISGTAPIVVTPGPGTITLSISGTIVTATDDTQYLSVAAGKVNLALNPGGTTGKVFDLYPKFADLPPNTVGSATPFVLATPGSGTTPVVTTDDNKQISLLIYIDKKMSFNKVSVNVTTIGSSPGSTGGVLTNGRVSVGLYSATGATLLMKTDVSSSEAIVGSVSGTLATTGVKTLPVLSGTAVSAGTATIQPGYYLLSFNQNGSTSSLSATKGSLARYMGYSYTTSSKYMEFINNAGNVFYLLGTGTGGDQLASPVTPTAESTTAAFFFPIIKFSLN